MDGAGELPTIDYKALFARVRLNRDLLDACPRHSFTDLPLGNIRLGGKIKCQVCGGEMDLVALNFYVRGYEAAGRSGNDILPNWKDDDTNSSPQRSYFAPDE